MSFLIDLIILAIIVVSVVVYTKRGLVGVIIDIAGFILASLVAWYFAPLVGGYISRFMRKIIPGEEGGLVSGLLTSDALSRVIAFGLVFIACMIAVKFIIRLTKDIKIPIISKVDKILGGVLGLLLGLAWAQIAAMIVFALLEILANLIPGFPTGAFEGLTVTKWFFEFNIFKSIFAAI